MSLVTRRRAIYTGLVRHLPEAELMPILSFWEANYAEKPPFALNEFLGEVVKRCSQKLERASLYRELIGIMNGPATALLPDPLPQLEDWRRGVGVNAAEVSGPEVQARQTFAALSEVLFAALTDVQLHALRQQLSSHLGALGLSTELRLRVRAWLEQGSGLARIQLELEQWRHLLNMIYEGLCEQLGPVAADQLLSRAVRQVDQLQLRLPPQKLL
jgi:hypothetical protein